MNTAHCLAYNEVRALDTKPHRMSLSNVTTPPMLTDLLRLHDNKNAQPSAFNLRSNLGPGTEYGVNVGVISGPMIHHMLMEACLYV